MGMGIGTPSHFARAAPVATGSCSIGGPCRSPSSAACVTLTSATISPITAEKRGTSCSGRLAYVYSPGGMDLVSSSRAASMAARPPVTGTWRRCRSPSAASPRRRCSSESCSGLNTGSGLVAAPPSAARACPLTHWLGLVLTCLRTPPERHRNPRASNHRHTVLSPRPCPPRHDGQRAVGEPEGRGQAVVPSRDIAYSRAARPEVKVLLGPE